MWIIKSDDLFTHNFQACIYLPSYYKVYQNTKFSNLLWHWAGSGREKIATLNEAERESRRIMRLRDQCLGQRGTWSAGIENPLASHERELEGQAGGAVASTAAGCGHDGTCRRWPWPMELRECRCCCLLFCRSASVF